MKLPYDFCHCDGKVNAQVDARVVFPCRQRFLCARYLAARTAGEHYHWLEASHDPQDECRSYISADRMRGTEAVS